MPPAARVTDMHVCPMVTGIVPHVGGPILPPGAPTVLIGFLPAATVSNMATCVGPPDVIIMGSTGVLINFLPAARMGDPTAHGGAIILGEPTVMIGEIGAPSPGAGGMGGVVAGLVAAGIVNPANPASYEALLGKAGKQGTPPPSQTAKSGASSHPAPKQCAGKGLAAPANQAEFAKGMKELQGKWPKMTPDDRAKAMAGLANKQLEKSGVPPIQVVEDDDVQKRGNNGEMHSNTWTLNVSPKVVDSPTLTDAQAESYGNTVYHESRHAEQYYLAARNMSAEGQTPAQIQAQGIKDSTAKTASAHPMTKDDPMAGCAKVMQGTFFTPAGAAHREDVLVKQRKHADALAKVASVQRKHYDEVLKDPKATYPQKLAEYNKTVALNKAAQEAQTTQYDNYRNLPEESDAWATGDGVGKL